MSRRGSRTRLAPGIFRDAYGLAAVVAARGVQREKRFPAQTPLRLLRAWQADTRAALLAALPDHVHGTLAADVERYLTAIRPTLRTHADREREIRAWLPRFGGVPTLHLDVPACNLQLRDWRADRSASTCNHRRDALTNLVRVLYGRAAALRLADLVRFELPDSVSRAVPLDVIDRVLAGLRDGSRTRVRLTLLRWTGMRPSQMARLTPASFRLDDVIPHVEVPRGKRGRLAVVPLGPLGVEAARAFAAAPDSFGPWSCPSANKALAASARRCQPPVEPFTVYAIRHSFAAALRAAGADLADVQELYGHTTPTITRIYAVPALAKLARAVARLEPERVD